MQVKINVQFLIVLLLFIRYHTTGLVQLEFNWLTNNFTETINSQTKGRWNSSKNDFINFSSEELVSLANLYGYHPNPKFNPYTKTNDSVKKQDIPVSFDARDAWPECTSIGTIRNQGHCGASWAFAAAEVMSDRLCIASGGMMKFTFSVEELISCCDKCGDGCNGGYLYPPFEYWRKTGIPSGGTELKSELLFSSAANELSKLTKGDLIDIIVTKEVPFAINVSKTTKEVIEQGNYKDKMLNQGCKPFTAMNGITPNCRETCWPSYNITLDKDRRHGVAAYHVDTDVMQIQAEIMQHGPVVAAMDLYKDFYSYSSGIYEHVSWDIVGHQAVKIIGWGVDNGLPYWLLTNSWGTHFGEEGFVRIQRGVNQCGIEYKVTGGTPDITE